VREGRKGAARAPRSAEPVESEIARIARRIRSWREEARFTLQELATRSGVATSTIQKVETLQMVPTVAVLLKIARGLGRSPGDFVSTRPPAESVVHLRAAERRAVGSRRGVMAERLSGDLLDAEVELWRVTVQPGSGSGSGTLAYRGEELALCEEGEIAFRVGDEEHRLRPGDVLHFKAAAPHAWRNPGRAPARFLILGTVPAELRRSLEARAPEERRRRA
jgi:transcriptional regulator with XRE-family HTH domain